MSSSSTAEISVTTAPTLPDKAAILLDSIRKTLCDNSLTLDERKKWLVIYELNSTSEKINGILSGTYSISCSTVNFDQALRLVRHALSAYYIKNGRLPRNLEELIPYHLPCLPLTNIRGTYGNTVKYIRNSRFDKDYRKAVDGSSEYLYFSDPQSVHCGLFIINSTEKTEEGYEYCSY